MPERTEEEEKSKQQRQQQQPNNNSAAAAIIDMDLDFDNSWPLDQISFPAFSNPMSPLLPSSSDRPYSPLWAFSDADDDRLAAAATHAISAFAAAGAGLRLSDSPILLSCHLLASSSGNSNSVAKSLTGKGDDRKASSPLLGWIPVENPDGYCLIKERMAQALRYFKESTEQHLLAQVWAPVKDGDRYVLTTSGQPFVLDPCSIGLHQYRMVSLSYMFSVDGETDGELGLPGRVFRQKLPEWSPDVQYYSSKEYSRLDHALSHNVHGTLALPVFEPSGQSCVGVLELIMTSQKIHYAPEVDKVCKALEAVNLKSSKILNHPNTQICNEGRQNALAEILEILTVACETHKLPLAQTWVPCMHRNVLTYGGGLKKSCTSFDGSCNGQVCMSTTDVAFYVVEAHMWGFREACLEHHLQKGQGVAGRAFLSHNSCFCRDITEFCKTEYPLVHYARMFGLSGCFAICLRSSYTGDDDYILEFFLPPQITDSSEQNTLLASLLVTMKQHLRSLKVASGVDLQEEEGFVEIIQASMGARIDTSLECMGIPQCTKFSPHASISPKEGPTVQLDSPKHQLMVTLDAKDNRNTTTPADGSHTDASVPQTKVSKKPSQRKRGKAEKSISLDVLQQYFAGSLKDAAKSLGVCPTTMKRICRQHGISRWPSRKIKKVNHSLSRLKRVIESVQGTEGAFNLTSLSTSPLPAGVGSMTWPSDSKVCNQQNSPNSKPPKPHFVGTGSPTCKTPGIDGEGVAEDQLLGGRILNQEELRMQNGFSPEVGQLSDRSKTRSDTREQSVGMPTSHGSCQGSPGNDNAPAKDRSISPVHNQYFESGGSPDLALKRIGELHLSAACSIPDALGGMLLEDAGSSKDLRNLCPAAADAIVDEQVPECSWTNLQCPDFPPSQTMATYTPVVPHAMASQEVKNMTVKATYREDIIRFRISLSSGIAELREEVARRLKLDVGTFDIKYVDDDYEWVLIACDADLQECMDVSSSSGRNIIRLSVHDVNANLGSSCESTGEL